ncbi:transferase family-domain-containing protein [Annulohypoxylon nitens]|nr:transferase family-domain-containing protein [Annulohypoxylon nitens]
MEDYSDFSRYQDIFGQLRLLKSYTHFLLCFQMPDGQSRESIVEELNSAITKLTATFPWLAAKVINEGSGNGNSGLFKVERCPQWEPPNSILVVKDCSDECASFTDIMAAKGPVDMLDAPMLTRFPSFPQSYQETEDDPAPVLSLQANFIRGGLLLDVAAQHNIMPGSGILQFLRLLSKAMAGESPTPLEIEQGNRDRRQMIRLLRPDEEPVNTSRYDRPSLLKIAIPAVPAPYGRWCTFRLSAKSMSALKDMCNDAASFVPPVTFVSSNDALTAFFWQRLVALRLARTPGSGTTTSKFVQAVDVRAVMGVPTEYMGHMVYNTFSQLTFTEIAEEPLATLASLMRKNLMEDVNERAVRSFVTRLANTPDKTTIMYGGDMSPNDVAFTSIAQADLYNVPFGVLGKMALFRRPKFIPRATTGILFPKTLDGITDFLVCLNDQDLADLKADSKWCTYAELIDKD